MNILPTYSYYLRRILRQSITSPTHYAPPDLLLSSSKNCYSLEARLHSIYTDNRVYENMVLYLEQLICSYQNAQRLENHLATQAILNQILWWLGYQVSPPLTHSSEKSEILRIFMVDDSIEMLKLVSAILSEKGYQFDSALSGKLALTKIQSNPPDLILLDIKLPDMDGYQVYDALQSSPITAHIPIIFLSGVDEAREIKLKAYRHLSYLAKPFQSEKLLNLVEYQHLSLSQKNRTTTVETELNCRKKQALKLLVELEKEVPGDEAIDPAFFFRATLDGRYLRVSHAFAQLCGYESSETMIAQVKDIWQQVYVSRDYRKQWSACLQSPNQFRRIATQIKTYQNKVVDIVENICLVNDIYEQPLFFQGYWRADSVNY